MKPSRTLSYTALVCLVALAASFPALAEEGMWRLSQLPTQRLTQEYGVKLDAAALARLQSAPVRILSGGGGGTGTFASPNGLILTNHHVALDCIRTSSLAEKGSSESLIDTGFTAASPSEELPCRRFRVQVERESRDVTAELDAVTQGDMSAAEIQLARQQTASNLERACTTEHGENFSCSVTEFNSGAQAFLIVYEEYRDIRLVYAPEKQLGYFGGEEMNFRFPRYVSDISILRAYEAEDGTHSEYGARNVAARPDHYLSVSFDGIREGDATLVAGFPGNTNRYRMSFSADYNLRKGIPRQIEDIDTEMALLERYASQSEANLLALQSRIFGLANNRKYLADVLTALEASDIVADRREREDDLMAFLRANPALMERYGDVLTLQASVYAEDVEANADLDAAISWLSRPSDIALAFGLYEFAREREKPSDASREPQFQERRWPQVRQGLLDDDPIIEGLEKDLLTIGMEKALALPAESRIEAVSNLVTARGGRADPRELARAVLSGSRVGTMAFREELIDASADRLERETDPAVAFARDFYPAVAARRERIRVLNQKLFLNRAKFARAMVAWRKDGLYPDANFTLRVSLGRAKGYTDRRGQAVPMTTTLAEMFELADRRAGEKDFALPPKLAAWRASLGDAGFAAYRDLPVDLVTTNDITGGNSGSALLNRSLEITGLIFDGNEDSTASDWTYNVQTGRAISTDIRFALTIARDVHGAGWIVDELVGTGDR